MSKVSQLIREEFGRGNPRIMLAKLLTAPLPNYVGNRFRTRILRAVGFRGISPNVVMWAFPTITGYGDIHKNLIVGEVCRFNLQCFLNLGAELRIGDHVGFGQQVMILTESHDIGGPEYRSGKLNPKPVTIGNGCWVGARATILPGVTIGDGCVVASGAVVTKDVPENTLVGGVPARVIRELEA